MSLKFTGGVSKSLGSVNAGLLEVSCKIEIEFDNKSSSDTDDIQRQVEQAFAAQCNGFSIPQWFDHLRFNRLGLGPPVPEVATRSIIAVGRSQPCRLPLSDRFLNSLLAPPPRESRLSAHVVRHNVM